VGIQLVTAVTIYHRAKVVYCRY